MTTIKPLTLQHFQSSAVRSPLSDASVATTDFYGDVNWSGREVMFLTTGKGGIHDSTTQELMGLQSGVSAIQGAYGAYVAKKQYTQAARLGSSSEKLKAGLYGTFSMGQSLGGLGFLGFRCTSIASVILAKTAGYTPAALTLAAMGSLIAGCALFSLFLSVLGIWAGYRVYQNYQLKKGIEKAEKQGNVLEYLYSHLQVDQKELKTQVASKLKGKNRTELFGVAEKLLGQLKLSPQDLKCDLYALKTEEIPDLIGELECKRALLRKEMELEKLVGKKYLEKIKEGTLTEADTQEFKKALHAQIKFFGLIIPTALIGISALSTAPLTGPIVGIAGFVLAIVLVALLIKIDADRTQIALHEETPVGKYDKLYLKLMAALTVTLFAASVALVIALSLATGPLIPAAAIVLGACVILYRSHRNVEKREQKEEERLQKIAQEEIKRQERENSLVSKESIRRLTLAANLIISTVYSVVQVVAYSFFGGMLYRT